MNNEEMNIKEKTSSNLHRRLGIIPLIFASIFLIMGTYAWFTYFSDVNSTMTGHVVGWNIDFNGEGEVEDYYTIIVDKIFPGMEDFSSDLVITNSGEAAAIITYSISEIKILGTSYKEGDVLDGKTLTSDDLLNMLTDAYPFKFAFNVDKPIINTGEKSTFTAGLTWPFETHLKVTDTDTYSDNVEYYTLVDGSYILTSVSAATFDALKDTLYYTNDIEDTKWGEAAFNFINTNPDAPCIELIIKVNASQYV